LFGKETAKKRSKGRFCVENKGKMLKQKNQKNIDLRMIV
jgi:hypothetical protein